MLLTMVSSMSHTSGNSAAGCRVLLARQLPTCTADASVLQGAASAQHGTLAFRCAGPSAVAAHHVDSEHNSSSTTTACFACSAATSSKDTLIAMLVYHLSRRTVDVMQD